MTIIFDGKSFAGKRENDLRIRVYELRKRRITPKLISILVGNGKGSKLYTSLKKAAAERIGAEMEVIELQKNVKTERLKDIIGKLNQDDNVHGVMIQLPLPGGLKPKTESLIQEIAPDKDVDGLRDDSLFTSPVVKAVVVALGQAQKIVRLALPAGRRSLKVTVVGAKGFEGKKIVKALESSGFQVTGLDKETKDLKLKTKKADVLISVTGIPDLIKPDMVKNGAVLIDVGAPKGDISKTAYEKAAFVSPVPGGIGPVTISCLTENLIESSEKIRSQRFDK